MKIFGLWTLLLVASTAFMCFAFFYGEGSITTSSNPGLVLGQHGSEAYMASTDHKYETDHQVLEDYRPIDPVPSSKASIKPGPIQHGTPLMPFIPQPSPPPSHPKQFGSP